MFHFLGVDPAICGGLLPIDAGGYPLALELAEDPLIGQYFGVVAAATFGCTIVFVIPVGMRYLDEDAQQDLAKGLLIGLAALPAGLIPGGLLCGLSLWDVLRQSFPILLISLLLLWGILRNTTITIRWFSLFSKGIQSVSSLGLILAAFQSLTGWTLISKLGSLEEAMAVVCSIGIVMLGCMPLTAILQAFMKKPIQYITQKITLSTKSVTGILLGIFIAMPTLAMLKNMDKQGRIVNGAFLVCGASAFSAHLGFVLSVSPNMVIPLLVTKIAGAFLAAGAAIHITQKEAPSP